MMCKTKTRYVETRERGSILSKLSPCQITVGWLQFLRSDWSCSRWEGGVGVRCWCWADCVYLRISAPLPLMLPLDGCASVFDVRLFIEGFIWFQKKRKSKQTWQTVRLLIHALFPIRLLWTRRLCETDNAPLPRIRTYPKEGARAILSIWTGTRRWKSQIALRAKVNAYHLFNIQQNKLYFSRVVSEMHL